MKIYSIKSKAKIKQAITTRKQTIAIFGMGKMGLPLACVFANKGFNVIGINTNQDTADKINNGENPVVGEEGLDNLLKKVVKDKKLYITTKALEAVKKADFVIIIVPTLVDKNKNPDLSMVESVCHSIGKGIQKGTMVILESTVPPGTTEKVVKKIIEKESKLIGGRDFGLAFCPERTNSGTAIADIEGRINPKIVGGLDEKSKYIAFLLYQKINKRGVISLSNLKVAEMVKITEMVYRDVKIAYANSLALICNQLKINAKDVINGANTDAGCEILRPGPGVGGHCIPVYPYFIFSKVKKYTDVVKSARKINDEMPNFTVKLVEDALAEKGKKLQDSSILVMGITYRGNVKEIRYSPALVVYKILTKKAKKVYAFDPLFSRQEIENMGLLFKDDYQGIDCIVITALHDSFKNLDFDKIGKQIRTKTFVDTTTFFDVSQIKKFGFSVKSIGLYLE